MRRLRVVIRCADGASERSRRGADEARGGRCGEYAADDDASDNPSVDASRTRTAGLHADVPSVGRVV
jgi:hypothetical protein